MPTFDFSNVRNFSPVRNFCDWYRVEIFFECGLAGHDLHAILVAVVLEVDPELSVRASTVNRVFLHRKIGAVGDPNGIVKAPEPLVLVTDMETHT